MLETGYSTTVRKLLRIGERFVGGKWIDYATEFGITQADVDELIRLAEDPDLNMEDPDSTEIWAPIHAIRALGELKAAAAVPRLISLIDEYAEDDWFRDELPGVFGKIGPAAVPELQKTVADVGNSDDTRTAAAIGLEKIAGRHPECYSDAVATIANVLERMDPKLADVNGVLICCLLDLKAVETLPLIHRVFRENCVDHFVVGWESIQMELGVDDPDPSPENFIDNRPDWMWMLGRPSTPPIRLSPNPFDFQIKRKERRKANKQQRKAKAKARRQAKRRRRR